MDTRPPIPFRRRLIRAAQSGAYWSGVLAGLPARGRAAILMYHSVAPPETARYVDVAWRMTPARFEQQVRFLARHRRVIPLAELVQRLREARAPEPGSVVLTFDDGYRDNLEIAAPILRKYGVPATFFLATGYVDRAESQWVDRLYVLFTTRQQHDCGTLPGVTQRWDLRDPRQCRAAHGAIALRLLETSHAEREEILGQVEAQLAPSEKPPRLTLDWNEVRELATRYPELEIGVHTADHIDLARSTPETIHAELERSIADVERELGRRPRHFSFPYGRSSPLASELAARAGLASAMGPSGPWLADACTDLYNLPRLDALMSPTQLRLRTHPAYASLPSEFANRG